MSRKETALLQAIERGASLGSENAQLITYRLMFAELVRQVPEAVLARVLRMEGGEISTSLEQLDEHLVANGDGPYGMDIIQNFKEDPLPLFNESVSVSVHLSHLFQEGSDEAEQEAVISQLPKWLGDIMESPEEDEVAFKLFPGIQNQARVIRDCLNGAKADDDTVVAIIVTAASMGASTLRFAQDAPELTADQLKDVQSKYQDLTGSSVEMEP